MVGGVQQLYSNSNPLHTPEQQQQQMNLAATQQSYSVHSKGMQDPRQQKLLLEQQQRPPYIKQVQVS